MKLLLICLATVGAIIGLVFIIMNEWKPAAIVWSAVSAFLFATNLHRG